MSEDFEQVQIQFGAQLASLHSKVKALKSLLTEQQLKIYNESLLKSKETFLQNHQEITDDTREKIDKAFS